MARDLSTIRAILFDTGGVLYHRPRQDRHLSAFLEQHGYKPRHRSVVEKGLRAARFDGQTGRISLDTLYDAILRMHGLDVLELFPAGRQALLRDAADIDLFPGVIETLHLLEERGCLLGTVSDTPHTVAQKSTWLAARGIPLDTWAAFIVSRDVGSTKAEPAIFELALSRMQITAAETAFVGHAAEELRTAHDLGILTIAFLPDDPAFPTDHTIASFFGLAALLLESHA